jgi:hypothetical protein
MGESFVANAFRVVYTACKAAAELVVEWDTKGTNRWSGGCDVITQLTAGCLPRCNVTRPVGTAISLKLRLKAATALAL